MKYIRKDAFINATQWTGDNYAELLELTDNQVVFSEHSGLLRLDGDDWIPARVGAYFQKKESYCVVISEDDFNKKYEAAE